VLGRSQITSLLGPTGCGKNTVLRLIAGFESPTSGQIVHDGHVIDSIGPDRAMVFQRPVLFQWMTVIDNLLFVAKGRGFDRKQVAASADEILEEVGLAQFRTHYPYELSGGMLQRLQLARALVSRANVMLLDEPFGALDAQTRFSMQVLLQRIYLNHRTTVVIVTHDIDEALFLSDRVIIMKSRPGKVIDDVSLDWPRPRGAETFSNPDFGQLKERLLKLLQDDQRTHH
jgi:NitT/TauT family transport system ATP-binding protein